MLTIEVKLNGVLVAHAAARNISDLTDVSDYLVTWNEVENAELDIESGFSKFMITAHRRRQTAWALVAKIVMRILGQKTGEPESRT